MKKYIRPILLLLCVILTVGPLAACKKDSGDGDTTTTPTTTAKPKEGLKIDKELIVLAVGQSESLTVTKLSTGEQTLAVIWSTDNDEVARVDTSGKVTALAEGKATITASTIDNKYSVKCEITVSASVVGLKLPEQITLSIGESSKLTAETIPAGIDVSLKWQSTVDSVVMVSDDGTVTGLMSGTSSVIVSTLDGSYMAACSVTVLNSIVSLTFNESTVKLNVGVSKKLDLTVLPADATTAQFTFESSNPNVATVSEGGVVTAVSVGTVTIKCTAQNGVTASCTVQVTMAATSLTLDLSELTVEINATAKLTATVFPENATVTELAWTTSDPSIVKVASDGTITALKVGTATVTVSLPDGGISTDCVITVIDPSVSITFDSTDITLKLGSESEDHMTLVPIVTPENPNETFTWTSSDDKIVSVSSSGIIRAKELGTAVITVKCSSGAVASVNVTVEKAPIVIPVEKVEVSSPLLSEGFVTVTEGRYIDVTVTFVPSSATDKEYTFEITGSAVKIKDGKLYALKEGAATVKVVANNNGKKVKSDAIVISVSALGDADKDRVLAEYKVKLSAENTLNATNIADIKAKYESDIKSIKSSIAAITTTEDDLAAEKSLLAVYEAKLKSAQDEGNADEIAKWQSNVDDSKAQIKLLEDDLETKSTLESSLKSKQSKLDDELKSEDERHNQVIDKLKDEYDYILRYDK